LYAELATVTNNLSATILGFRLYVGTNGAVAVGEG
jgi:hypothetical protein